MYYNGHKVFILNDINFVFQEGSQMRGGFYNERKAYDQYNKTTVCAGV